MNAAIDSLLNETNTPSHSNQGIRVVTATSQNGLNLAKKILYKITDQRTLLLLSGGRTPKDLYTSLAKDEELRIGAGGHIDERYGNPLHSNSNQKMLEDTGLIRYFQMRGIPFHQVLSGKSREKSSEVYDKVLRELFSMYRQTIGVLGIGLDGHTAGIAGNRKDFKNPVFDEARRNEYVSEFNDKEGMFKERITMTFVGLSMLDLYIVLVFGDDKKEALDLVFELGKEEEIPARFYKRPEIAAKTLLITDQGA